MTTLRTIREDGDSVVILDQTRLPLHSEFVVLRTLDDAAHAIRSMQVRGAPLIGVTAAYGVALALQSGSSLEDSLATLAATRPTAVNLQWALQRMATVLLPLPAVMRPERAWQHARRIAAEDVAANRAIGEFGLAELRQRAAAKREAIARLSPPLATAPSSALNGNGGRTGDGAHLNVMTHCNAGWLATVAHGTALAPVYAAQAAGMALHVWVSETRPRNQGLLTAWELAAAGVPHTLIADNAAGLLLMQGRVDAIIVGADRIAANGDVANKVGTYLKALAAQAHGVPFYVAAPRSTIDFHCATGADIPIEERAGDELGAACATPVCNPAFDVTPAALVSGIITEHGLFAPGQLAALQS